jgi:hypothetical protein
MHSIFESSKERIEQLVRASSHSEQMVIIICIFCLDADRESECKEVLLNRDSLLR